MKTTIETLNQTILGNIYQIAYNAHANTSFDPEKRAIQVINDYSEELTKDMEIVNNDERYKERYIALLKTWLYSRSNCYSVMITGPANFNNSRHEKANRAEENKYREFREWRERALKAIEKRIEAQRPQAEKDSEALEIIKKNVLERIKTIQEIDKGINTYTSRQLIVANLTGFIKRMAQNGQTEHVKCIIDLIRQADEIGKKSILSSNNQVFKLVEIAENVEQKNEELNNRENKEISFEGGKIIFNYAIDRIQIKHDEKPGSDVITKLKSCAFKWSPSQQVWQRQLTGNAIFAVKNQLGITF